MVDVNQRVQEVSTSYAFQKMLAFVSKARQADRNRRWLALKAKAAEEEMGVTHPLVVAEYIDGSIGKTR
jgi:hypothetical protein